MAFKPITIKDSKHNFNTTRQEFMNDNNRKLGGSGKFSFRKYKTDKERVEEILWEKEQNEKQALKNLSQKKENSSAEEEKLKKLKTSVKQPIMRFRPRTDLERIYYTINSFSYGKVSKDAVNEQMKKLELFGKQKEKEENSETNIPAKYDNLDEKQIEEFVSQKEFLNNQGYNEKNSETIKQITLILDYYSKKHSKIEDDPSLFQSKQAWRTHVNLKATKKFLGENNHKTHFKAASVFSFNLDEFKNKAKSNMKHTGFDKKENTGNGNNNMCNSNEPRKQQNKSSRDNYLNFNYYDEPGHSEDEENGYFNNNKNDFYSNNSKKKFNKTANDFSRINDLLLKTYKNGSNNKNDNKDKVIRSIPVNTFDFNPFEKNDEKEHDIKSLLYLKRLAQSSSVVDVNEDMKKSTGYGNYGFLANLNKKNIKDDSYNNLLSKEICINEVEDMRNKCKLFFLIFLFFDFFCLTIYFYKII
jgi:hypothetical protein